VRSTCSQMGLDNGFARVRELRDLSAERLRVAGLKHCWTGNLHLLRLFLSRTAIIQDSGSRITLPTSTEERVNANANASGRLTP
jgi:hypothetical protein